MIGFAVKLDTISCASCELENSYHQDNSNAIVPPSFGFTRVRNTPRSIPRYFCNRQCAQISNSATLLPNVILSALFRLLSLKTFRLGGRVCGQNKPGLTFLSQLTPYILAAENCAAGGWRQCTSADHPPACTWTGCQAATSAARSPPARCRPVGAWPYALNSRYL